MTKSDQLLQAMLEQAGNPETSLLVEVANHLANQSARDIIELTSK